MKIHCPKCNTCYSVEIGLVPADGKKFRCSKCGEVWLCTHKDFNIQDSSQPEQSDNSSESVPQNVIANENDELLNTPNTEEISPEENTETADDMNIIFARLQNETTKISEEYEKLSPLKKFFPKLKKILGWDSRFSISLEFFTVLVIIILSIFANRFELVRKFPQTEQIFKTIGIPARVIGEGLEFQNITRKYINPDNNKQLSINGFIFNTTDKTIEIPTITVSLLNENTDNIIKVKKQAEIKTIRAKEKLPFNLLIDIPPEKAKYILLTFTE